MSVLFVSYSSSNAETAAPLTDRLRDAGYVAVFRDHDKWQGIPGGTAWANELVGNVERADVVIFLAGSDSLTSVWCNIELAIAVARGKHIVQVAIGDFLPHPLISQRQGLSASSIEELVEVLVRDLSRVGHPPGDPFDWDRNSSPYPGLGRLTDDHAAVIFGREREITTIIDRLSVARADPVLVVGPSGSGKSSLVLAGVRPRLKLQRSTIVPPVVEPGGHGLRRVMAALLAADNTGSSGADLGNMVDRLVVDGGRIVLILDQVEDALARLSIEETVSLFTQLRDIDRDRLAVVVVLRSASLESWMQRPELASFTPNDPIWIRPMERGALREVIMGPAQRAGIRFEPAELVDRILEDTGQGQALPLLAAMLEELTREHSRLTPAVITTQKYETVGPVSRVVDRRANASMEELSLHHGITEVVAVQAYLRLVDIDEYGNTSRSELSVDELGSVERSVYEVLERHRLVVRDSRLTAVGGQGRMTEVLIPPHEEVFRAWPALARAITDEHVDLEIRTWLRSDARTWARSGRGSVPLSGGRLDIAVDWRDRHPAEAKQGPIGDYVAAAIQQRRRRRLLAVVAPVLVVVLVIISILAVQLAREGQRTDEARIQADALRLLGASASTLESRRDLGLLLALEAASRSDDIQVDAAPLIGLTRGAGPVAFRQLVGPIGLGAMDSTGDRALVASAEGISMWDVAAEHEIGTLDAEATALAIESDGSTVAIASDDHVAKYRWGATTDPIATCATQGGAIELLRLIEGGNRLLAVTVDRSTTPATSVVRLVDLVDCQNVFAQTLPGQAVDVDISGNTFAVALEDEGIAVRTIDPNSAVLTMPATEGAIRAVRFGGAQLAAGTERGGVWLWDSLDTPPQNVRVASQSISAVQFTGDGRSLIVTDIDGGLRVVDPHSDPAIGPRATALPRLGYQGSVAAMDIVGSGLRVATLDPSGRVVDWDLSGQWIGAGAPLAEGRFNLLEPMPSGDVMAAGPMGIWMLRPAQSRAELIAADVADVTALSGAGGQWTAGRRTGDVLLGDLDNRDPPRTVARMGSEVRGVTMFEDGSLAAVSSDGSLLRRDAAGHELTTPLDAEPRAMAGNRGFLIVGLRSGVVLVVDNKRPDHVPLRIPAHETDADAIAVSPSGDFVATGGDDRAAVVWQQDNSGNLTEKFRLAGHKDRVTSLAFSQDGRWLASGSEDNTIILWDLVRGEQVGEPIATSVIPRLAFAVTGAPILNVAGNGWETLSMDPQAWIDTACEALGSRGFDPVERQRFLRGTEPATMCH